MIPVSKSFTEPLVGDPLFPLATLLPLSDTRGGHVPLVGTPGPLRPLSAALGITPVECGKHDTMMSKTSSPDGPGRNTALVISGEDATA